MALIEVCDLKKEFKHQKREKGFLGTVKGLIKREYEIKSAVDNISFSINRGEIVGYIGPNGAGKSTTIKILAGILVPTSGKVRVNGLIPYKSRIENAKKIGVVFGQRTQLWWDIPVSESLNLMRYMYRISDDQYNSNIKLFSDILDIHKFINLPVRQLSLGQRMRADLCAALLHNPDIIYLDEPTIGLDVMVKKSIREFIKEINRERDTTIILTTHDMSDIEKLCSRVMVIDHGNIMYDGSLEQLKSQYGSNEMLSIEIESSANSNVEELYEQGVDEIKNDGSKIIVKYNKSVINSSAIVSWLMERFKVRDFIVYGTEIDEIIRQMYITNNKWNYGACFAWRSILK